MSEINVRNRKRTDGTANWEYYFEIAEQNGKRKRKSKSGFKTKKEALAAGIEALHRYNGCGQLIEPSEISVSDFLDLWIEKYCQNELSPNTTIGYNKKINLYIKPVIGEYKLKALTPMILSDLLQDMKQKGFSRNTIVSVKGILSASLSYAVNPLQYLPSSPMVYVKLSKECENQKVQSAVGGNRSDGKVNGNKRGSSPHVYIPKDKIDKIFERFPLGHPDHIPLLIGYKLGLRIGEAYALCVEDFDFSKNMVKIDKQVQWNETTQKWYFKNPKYGSVRTISFDESFAALIKSKIDQIQKDKDFYKEFYTRYYIDENKQINDISGKEIHLLNVRENGTYIQQRTMQHCSYIIHTQLGFPEFDYHSLRHTHATDLARFGATPKFVQTRLGHKSIKVTMEIYQHLTEDMEIDGQSILNKMYNT